MAYVIYIVFIYERMMGAHCVVGRVVAARGGFYRVQAEGVGAVDCRLRGKLKRKGAFSDIEGGACVGDIVHVSLFAENGGQIVGMVEEVHKRANLLLRPRIANIELCVAVLATQEPVYDLLLLDKILLIAAYNGIEAAICFNKADLAEEGLAALLEVYRLAGFKVVLVSALTGQGLADLRLLLDNKIAVLAGPSGVGKSSLLNVLLPDYQGSVGDISTRLQRGRHTTRHVSLLSLPNGGLVADTPGFSLLDLPGELKAKNLSIMYPEYKNIALNCRFLSCLHRYEPDCAVKEKLAAGKTDRGRYERYLRIIDEIEVRR